MPTTNPSNRVKYGLKNVHYALLLTDTEDGATYGTPVALPGAVALSLDAAGDSNTFYADNMAYEVTQANDGYNGTLELALITDGFRTDVLKEVADETDSVLVEKASAKTAAFALLFEFDGDAKAVRHVMYNCTASRPGVTSKTTGQTKEPGTDSLSLVASPLANDNVKAKTTADTTSTAYAGWFEAVWQPDAESDA